MTCIFTDSPPEILFKITDLLDHESHTNLIRVNKYLNSLLLSQMYKNIIIGIFDFQFPEEEKLTHSILKLPSYSHIKDYTIVTLAQLPKLLKTLSIPKYSNLVERLILCSKDSMVCFELLTNVNLFKNLKQVRVRCSPWINTWKKLDKTVIEGPIIYNQGFFESIDHTAVNTTQRQWNISGYSYSLPCVLVPRKVHENIYDISHLAYLELTKGAFLYVLEKQLLNTNEGNQLLKVDILEFTDTLFNVSLKDVTSLIDFSTVKTLSCSVDCRSELRNLISVIKPENFKNLRELALLYSIYDGKLAEGVFPNLTKLKVDLSAHRLFDQNKELLDMTNNGIDIINKVGKFGMIIDDIFSDSFPDLEHLEIKGYAPYFQEKISTAELLCDCEHCLESQILMQNFKLQHCSVVDSKSGLKITHKIDTYALPVDCIGHWCIGECFLDCPIFVMPVDYEGDERNKEIIQKTRLNLHLKLKNILAKSIKYKNKYTDSELDEILGLFHHKCDGVDCFKSLYTMFFHHYSIFIHSFIGNFPNLKTVTLVQGYIHKVIRDVDGKVVGYQCLSNISLPFDVSVLERKISNIQGSE